MNTQLYFEEVLDDLYIAKTCTECKMDCKILCITKDAEIYCSRKKLSK